METPYGNSKIRDFLKCRRNYYYRNILNKESITKSVALIVGDAVHISLAAHYNGYNYMRVLSERIAESKALYETYDQWENIEAKCALYIEGYLNNWASLDLEAYELVYPEFECSIALPNGKPFTARLDRILKERNTGRFLLLETKTSGLGKVKAERYFADLAYLDRQLTGNIYVAQTFTGLTIVGAIFDVIVKATVPDYFRLPPVLRTARELEVWASETVTIRQEMEQCTDYYRNLDQCVPPLLSKCDFHEVCIFGEFLLDNASLFRDRTPLDTTPTAKKEE